MKIGVTCSVNMLKSYVIIIDAQSSKGENGEIFFLRKSSDQCITVHHNYRKIPF
jgi:hypothetical protein